MQQYPMVLTRGQPPGPRRRKRRRARLGSLLLVLALLAAVLVTIRLVWPIEDILAGLAAASGTAGFHTMADDTVLAELQALLPEYPALAPVLENPGAYPTGLMELFLRNPETIGVLTAYSEAKRTPGAVVLSENELQSRQLLLQWDDRWAYAAYGEDMMALTGCGPACLSMAALWLGGDSSLHPLAVAQIAQSEGYYRNGVGTSWDLMTSGAKALGLTSEEVPLDQNAINGHLSQGAVVILSVGPGDFTTTGHFIVLAGVNETGAYVVRDPNSPLRSARTWSYDEISGQIRNIWAVSL